MFPNNHDFFLHIFLKYVTKPSVGNTSGFPRIKWPQIIYQSLPKPSPESGSTPKPPRPSPQPSPEPCWTWPGSAPKASKTFSGTLLVLTWLWTKASRTFSGTFFGTLLNLTWLCTKAARNLLRNLLRTWTWPGSAPKPPGPFATFSGSPEPAPKPFRPSLEPSPESCWMWLGSAPKPPRPSPEPSEPSPEPRWTWPGAWSYSGLKTLLGYAVGG